MFMVHPLAEVRDAAQELSQVISAEGVALSLNREVYQALAAVDVSAEDAATKYYMERTLLGYRLSVWIRMMRRGTGFARWPTR